MELKVWVDGIQRVVCGANYSTTCQDVVLALAHAMGRTGRFTLVEKWRESERPLTPTECPLQSLHKWGEYAPEVKFYLIQAQKSNHIQQTHHKTQTLDGGKKDSFGDKLSPRLSKYPGNPTGYESLKRSSTFSGAHGTNYTPSTLASSMSAAVSSYYAHNQESYEPPSSSSTPAAGKVRRTTLRSIPNGDVQNIPSNSSSQRTLRHPPGSSRAPLAPQADPNRGDARELHPANLPASSFKYPGRDFGASHQHKTSQLPSTVQHLNTAPHPVPTQHAHAPLKQKSPSASISHALQPSSQPSLVSSFQYSNSETNYPQQNSETNLPQKLNSQTSHSHQPFSKNNPAHNNDRPLPQPRHPQALQGGAEYENFNNNHQQHYPLPPQPRQRSKERLPAKLPEVSRQTHSSNTYDQHRSDTLDQHRSDPLDQLKSEAHDSFYSMDGSISSHVTERHNFKKRHENKTTREGSDNIISNRVTQGLTSRVDGYRHPIDDSEHPHKSATLERSVPQQRKSLPPTSRSQSVSGPEQNQPLDNPAASKSAVGHLRRSGDIGKLSFVESALMKNSKPATDGSKSGAKSSFASAVAHLRQHSAEGNLKPKTDPHVRQHSSDSSHTDASFQPGQEYSNKDKPDHGEPFNNAQHHQHPHHNISPHDTATLSSHSQISSSWNGSAFTEISIKRGSPSSPSFAPVPYNLDQANFSHSGNIVRNTTPSGAESHSREASLEIEEYDLDQRFPDVYHHEGGLKPVTVEYSLESGSVMPAKSEAEYLQLVRLVKMQQEKLEMQEAQINDSSTEITALEKQGSVDEGTLEVIVAEMSQLEKQESDWKLELDNLERVEWVNVLDGERKMEAKIKLQMSKLKEEIDQIERKLKELRAEEERLTREGQVERDKMAAKKSKAEEADKETSTRMGKLNNKLAILGKNIKENEAKLKDLESLISKTEEMLDNQKKQVEAMEEEVKYEEVQETQNHPLSEDATSPVNQITASQQSNRAASLSASDSGEAILKILEGRLSPHPYPDSLSNDHMTAAGQKFKSQLAAKNPNGVWV